MAKSKKQVLADFDQYRSSLKKSHLVNRDERMADKSKRKEKLLSGPVAFIKYYFPHIVKVEPAPFHKEALIRNKDVKVAMELWDWFRGASKTDLAKMFLIYKVLKGDFKTILYTSKTESKAIFLLSGIKKEFENNDRLKNDFDDQKTLGSWTEGYFKLKNGAAFFAIGKGQSPRGLKEDENRPDCIVLDDIDDEEELRNPQRLDNSFEWVMAALYGTFGAAGGFFLVVNNKLAVDCIVTRIAKRPTAKYIEVRVTNDKGESSWPELWTPEAIQRKRDDLPEYIFRREYEGEMIKVGKTFKTEWFVFGKIPPLTEFTNLLTYLDPGFKDTKTSDTKSSWLMGLHKGKYYIIKGFVDKASVTKMVDWHYDLHKYVTQKQGTCKMYMEEVFLQGLLFKDFQDASERYGYPLPIQGDQRAKPDKDSRIESITGYFEKGYVIFNEEEKDNHHTQRLIDQFLMFQPGVKTPKDGPDSIEGGFFKLREKLISPHEVTVGTNPKNLKRF